MTVHANFNTEDQAVRTLSARRVLGHVLTLLARYRWFSLAVVVIALLVALAEGVMIGLIVPFLDSIRGSGDPSIAERTPIAFLVPYFEGLSTVTKIRWVALGLLAVQLVKAALGYLNGRLVQLLGLRVDRDLRIEVFDQLLAVELGFINREQIANLFTILNNYPGHTSRIVLALVQVVPQLAILALYVAILLTISAPLTGLAIVMAALTTWAMSGLTRRARVLGRRVNQAAVRLNHVGFESLSGMRLIRLFGREEDSRDRFTRAVRDHQDRAYRKSLVDALVSPLYGSLNVVVLMVLLVSATFLLDRTAAYWVELLLVFMFVFFRLTGPAAAINKTRAAIAGYLPSMESLMDFLERQDKPFLEDGDRDFVGLREAVRLDDVRFRYGSDEADVLRGVSFEIPKGRTTAIVGGSGAGKTTLVDLLVRLYDPTGGRILVDGTDLRSLRAASWRSRVGTVSQDTFIFNDTVRSNIAFGRPGASDAEVHEAARKANADEFIRDLPAGYDTVLGDRGVRLSGGQAQRISIARAVLSDPELLILDEATSALDAASERLVQQAIERVTRDRTVVVIAHRLATVRNADGIIVLEGGRVVERGTHAELLARRGDYWRYVNLQNLDAPARPAREPARPDDGAAGPTGAAGAADEGELSTLEREREH